MDSRWRFLHRQENEAMTQKDIMSRVMVNPVAKRVWQLVKNGCRKNRSEGESEIRVAKHGNSRWREKLLVHRKGARTTNRRR